MSSSDNLQSALVPRKAEQDKAEGKDQSSTEVSFMLSVFLVIPVVFLFLAVGAAMKGIVR